MVAISAHFNKLGASKDARNYAKDLIDRYNNEDRSLALLEAMESHAQHYEKKPEEPAAVEDTPLVGSDPLKEQEEAADAIDDK
jgi:hypothetical protein